MEKLQMTLIDFTTLHKNKYIACFGTRNILLRMGDDNGIIKLALMLEIILGFILH